MGKKFEELKKYMDEKFKQLDGSLEELCSALIEKFTKEVKSAIKKHWTNKITK